MRNSKPAQCLPAGAPVWTAGEAMTNATQTHRRIGRAEEVMFIAYTHTAPDLTRMDIRSLAGR